MYLSKLLSSNYFLPITIAFTIMMHATFLKLPPKSMHLWRQCNTLAMARNFYEEGMNPLTPRVDNRFDTDGITGSQFPSFEIVLASIYKVAGEHFWAQRTYCLALHILGLLGIFLFIRKLTGDTSLANLGVWTYAWSPMLFYYSITALPDDLALPSSIWGLYAFLKWFRLWVKAKRFAWFWMLISFLLITIAGLTKIQYLALGFFIVGYVWVHRKSVNTKHWIAFAIFGLSCSTIAISWYLYAKELIQRSGLQDFGLLFKPEDDFQRGLSTLLSNLTSTLPENLLNYSSFVFVLAGIYFFFTQKQPNYKLRIPFLLWTFVFVIYHFVELRQMEHHDYYMMPYMPILIIASSYGVLHLLESKWKTVVAILVSIQPILAYARIAPARFLSMETDDKNIFYHKESLERLQSCVPDSELCVVGPDNSRCIYFYFLKKKGFGFGEDGLTEESLGSAVKRGARYLYTSDKKIIQEEPVEEYIDSLLCNEGNFFVYSLKIPSK